MDRFAARLSASMRDCRSTMTVVVRGTIGSSKGAESKGPMADSREEASSKRDMLLAYDGEGWIACKWAR